MTVSPASPPSGVPKGASGHPSAPAALLKPAATTAAAEEAAATAGRRRAEGAGPPVPPKSPPAPPPGACEGDLALEDLVTGARRRS